MKKLSLKNLKVVKMSNEEKKTINGGLYASADVNCTSGPCNQLSNQFVSWCNSCPA